jgi:hypothetical protein
MWVKARPRPLYPRERNRTHSIGGWVGPRAGLGKCGKNRPHRNSIPGTPPRSESLYRLSYPGPRLKYSNSFIADEIICSGHVKRNRVSGEIFPGVARNRSSFRVSGNIYTKPMRTILLSSANLQVLHFIYLFNKYKY